MGGSEETSEKSELEELGGGEHKPSHPMPHKHTRFQKIWLALRVYENVSRDLEVV
jgi:hypothetical protein